jgi:phosphatidylethanolamine/phosphatidyl-N-methylethanolamine N-methyltransferase
VMTTSNPPRYRWPKSRPQLSAEQVRVMEDWYAFFLGGAKWDKFSAIERFNQEYPLRSMVNHCRTLEIGPGNGSHLEFEDLDRHDEYVGIELRPNLSAEIERKYPKVRVIVGDCQRRIDAPDDHFDRAVAIHVLEHLDDLPSGLRELNRVLKPTGRLSIVIPCEGGLGYRLGRAVTTKRMFEKRYKMPYEWMIRYDHINSAREILAELKRHFRVVHNHYYPLRVPLVDANLVIGMTLSPIKDGR